MSTASTVSPLSLCWITGVCMLRCNLPPVLLAEWAVVPAGDCNPPITSLAPCQLSYPYPTQVYVWTDLPPISPLTAKSHNCTRLNISTSLQPSHYKKPKLHTCLNISTSPQPSHYKKPKQHTSCQQYLLRATHVHSCRLWLQTCLLFGYLHW